MLHMWRTFCSFSSNSLYHAENRAVAKVCQKYKKKSSEQIAEGYLEGVRVWDALLLCVLLYLKVHGVFSYAFLKHERGCSTSGKWRPSA